MYESSDGGQSWNIYRKQGVGAIDKIIKAKDFYLPKPRRNMKLFICDAFIVPWWVSPTDIDHLKEIIFRYLSKIAKRHMLVILDYCRSFPQMKRFVVKIGTEDASFNFKQILDNDVDGFAYFLSSNPVLKKLQLANNRITDIGVNSLCEGLKNNTIMLELDLKSNKIGDNGATALSQLLKINSTLSKLDIRKNLLIGSVGAKALSVVLMRIKTMKKFSGIPIFALKNNDTRVTKLKSENNGVCNSEAFIIFNCLEENCKLKEIWLGNNEISDDAAAVISQGLKKNSILKILFLNCNKLEDKGVCVIAESLKENFTLRLISLAANKFGDVGVVSIAKALKTNRTLKQLFLYRTEVGDTGAFALAEVLINHPTIEKLDILAATKIGPKGKSALQKAKKGNKKWKKLK